MFFNILDASFFKENIEAKNIWNYQQENEVFFVCWYLWSISHAHTYSENKGHHDANFVIYW